MYSYPTNITKLADLALWTNNVTSGFFWPLILFAIFMILFLSFMSYGTTRAFAGSSFITMILAIMMGVIGLVSSYVWVGTIILAAAALMCMYAANHREY